MPNVDLSRSDFLLKLKIGEIDTGSGTLFGVPQRRAASQSRLTLVISTGGSGKAAILKALSIANQKLEINYSNFIKFLVVDSATKELEPLKKAGIDVLNISSPMPQDRLKNEKRSPFYQHFIKEDFPIHRLDSEGSNQMRQVGKVKFYDKQDGSTNDQIFENKIKGYFEGDWQPYKEKEVDIMVLTGIAGGNGSGTFLDIAVRARRACPNPSKVKVYGYIMLPDTAEKFAGSDDAKKSLYRNGFAALKELESYESLSMESGREEVFDFPNGSIKVNSLKKPYDYPVLMSGDYDKAVGIIAETIVNTAANIQQTADDIDGPFGQSSFYSNRDVQRDNKLTKNEVSRYGILKAGACPEDSHMYCSIGYANASIPEKIVIPHVVGKVCKTVYSPVGNAVLGEASNTAATFFCTKERSLSKTDFQSAIRELLGLSPRDTLDESSLWNIISGNMRRFCIPQNNNYEVSRNEAVTGKSEKYERGFGITAKTEEATKHMSDAIAGEFGNFKSRAQSIMKKYGPRAMEFLYDGTGNIGEDGKKESYSDICLKTQIDYVKTQFMNQKAGDKPRKIKPLGLGGTIISVVTDKPFDTWKQNMRNWAEREITFKVSQNMQGANGEWQVKYVTPMADFLWAAARFADVLETIADYYEGVGKSLATDSFQDFAEQGGEANGINLCRDAEMYLWVKDRVNRKLADVSTRIQDIREKLIDDFYQNTAAWTSNEDGVARKEFDEIMSKACKVGKYAGANNGMDLTITDYFSHVLEDVPPSEQQIKINNSVNTIFDQLMTVSTPCLKLKEGVTRTCNGTIMLPQSLKAGNSGPMIEKAFKDKLKDSNKKQANLVFSSVVDSIVCYQTSVADALSDIADIDKWEKAYEEVLDATTHLHNGQYPTLHMDTGHSQYNELSMSQTAFEEHIHGKRDVYPAKAEEKDAKAVLDSIYGTGLSWPHYPSINVGKYGNEFGGSSNTLEASYRRDIFAKKIEEALRLGVIECVRDGDVYKYYANIIPRGWTNFGVRGYMSKRKNGLYVRGKELFEHLAAQNPETTEPFRKQIYLQDTQFFGPDGFDFSEAISNDHWNQARIDREHKAYMMRVVRKSTGLYQDMEDTLFKLYPVEFELQKKEVKVLRRLQYRKFFEMYTKGIVNSDEKGAKWDAVVDSSGETEELVIFTKYLLQELDELDKAMILDKLRLYYVYKEYAEIRKAFNLTDEKLSEIESKINKKSKTARAEFEALFEKRMARLNAEYENYSNKYLDGDDPIDAMMEAYKIDDSYWMKELKAVSEFYEALGEMIKEVNILTEEEDDYL